MTPAELLWKWLTKRLNQDTLKWLENCVRKIQNDNLDADLFLFFSLAPKKTNKHLLSLDASELQQANFARAGWNPQNWTIEQAARLYILLSSAFDANQFLRRVDQLFNTADVAELVTLYQGLHLYPNEEQFRLRAAEGVRTNMRVVFEAVAHHNPYPAEQLPEGAWNQMVLKALFVGSPLHPIIGLDQRVNKNLAQMLSDYAHERWSAGRNVSPELWRCVGPYATGPLLADVERVLEKGTQTERAAAMLALKVSPDLEARRMFNQSPGLASTITSGALSWQTLESITFA